ncbi:hypothetical protein GOBAR_AA08988 [Gossypium barbadense]|uniref:Disease resistance RPP13-like protein 1 n=1 Tax=Gossypium barbadense TaxID=3634 RepID=A0A2P5Y7U0_GOSBA|nr:hypothetical protein GOBAR_AA08988 [Gossypium barbadense]
MSVFGEAALSAFLELLSAKLLDSVLNFVADHRQVHQQLKLWQSILPEIKTVLNHAEEKQIKDEGVKNWLDDLQDLAYDVDDILDEFAYQELRLKHQKTQPQASTSKIQKLIPTCCTGGNFSPISFMFNAKMISKINTITDRLNSLNTRRSSLGLSEIMSQGATSKGNKTRLQPASLMDGAVEYVGRANEKQEMLELLNSNNSDGVCVLSIVGMGGMGKTTLAQLVYNDPSIKESFDHKSWVCVSDDFDAVNITKTILRSLDAESRDENDLNLLQVKLKEKLSGKRFLLVLDDIWNESYSDWTILRTPFGAGTKIIVTTRLEKVSSNVDSVKAFYLDKLSHHDCLSIFAQHALKARNFDGHLQFKEIGENIVRSEIWDLPEDPCGLIPALRLNYHYLPPHLKRCFAYCSIFPKDYEFEEEEIILLWRAEGFLQSKAKIQGKGLGNQYFQDLVSRSFFQRSGKDKSRFVMHDLMNDLAQSIAGEICCRLEGDKQSKFSLRTRHSAYVSDDGYHSVKKFEAFYQMTSLHTFLPLLHGKCHFYLTNVVVEDLLPRLSCLRVLSLRGWEGDGHLIRELKNLSNLRGNFCLSGLENVNGQDVREAKLNGKLGIDGLELQWGEDLENSSFKNLSSLKLRNCKNCKSLPSVGRLPLLKDLSIIGFDQVQKIGVEFFGENQLNPFASLEILSFESLPNWKEWDTCEGDEKVLKLPSLRELSIKTCPQLLGRLPTHLPSLQKLEIHSCMSLVVSISSFPSLCELSIRGCAELVDDCSSPAKEISFLQTLSLSNISKFNIPADRTMLRFGKSEHFEIGGWEELASLSQHGFSLVGHRFITVGCCPQLQSLEAEEAELQPDKISRVESLMIVSCDGLNRLPQVLHELTFLTVMEIQGFRGLVSFTENNLPPNLKKLKIAGCENLKHLVDENEDKIGLPTTSFRTFVVDGCGNFGALPKCMASITSLRRLSVLNCSADISFPSEGFPANITSLEIINAPKNYRSLVEWGLNSLSSLQELIIGGEGCSNVVSFPEKGTRMMLPPSLTRIFLSGFENLEFMFSEGFQDLASLKELMIGDCPKLTSLPEKYMLRSLGHLHIFSCPLLKKECSSNNGREWSKISHIPLVQIDLEIVIPEESEWNMILKICDWFLQIHGRGTKNHFKHL